MNRPVIRLYVLLIVLFAVLVGFTSRWSVFQAEALRNNPNNHRQVLEEQLIRRGLIRARDGALLAGNRQLPGKRYTRRYPTGSLFALPVGYNSFRFGRAGLERYYNDDLNGQKNEFASILDQLGSRTRVGDDLRTTLDPKAQKVAYQALNGHKGAVVAMDVRSGAVRVLAGTPSFDPDNPNRGSTFNLATQGLFPPGSTFKTVTAVAAIDAGRYTPNSLVSGRNGKIISGTPLQNFGGENFGPITLTDALTHSVNTVFGEVGVKLGPTTMSKYMTRFGFNAKPPMDYPADQMSASGSYRGGHVIDETSRFIDVGRMAIGQDKLLVTPLQMATVAQTIGNGGVRMEPRLVQRVVDPDGRTVSTPLPQRAQRVMTPATAAKLTAMMKQVVKEGTGTAAALQGVEVAGKTGTAELNNNGLNDLWFIAFTPTEAVAAVVANVQGGQGGTVAAPIAKQVLQRSGSDVAAIKRDTVIDGRYRVAHKLGSGGMADVWCAEDQQLGRRVALKLLAGRFAEDDAFRERFRREAQAAAGLQHPNIVGIFDRGEWDGTPYIAMEFISGPTLKQLVREQGPLEPDRAIDLAIQILRALRYAHKHGIVHRDIKPQNVILDEEGAAKVADFGIAHAGASELTETGSIVGTAQYLSPEQAQGQPVSPRSDLYSVGIVLYELLTGRPPFEASSPVTVALKQVSERPVPPSQLHPGISPALESVVLRALEKDPARRFANADEFIAALEAARRAPAVVLEPTPGEPLEAVEEDEGRKWWVWLLVLLAVLALAIGAYLLFVPKQKTVPPVVGQTSAKAAQTLHKQGFEVNIVSRVDASVARDHVISQDPAGGDRAREGSTVTLTVSGGPGQVGVPTVQGLSQADAEQRLQQAGLKPRVHKLNSDNVASGTAIGTSPAAGTVVDKGTEVTLTVSKGKAKVKVPDVMGLDSATAQSDLKQAGLGVAVVKKTSKSQKPGTVIAQDPGAGTSVPKGSVISLTVAKKPPQVAVPDVTTTHPTEADARTTLTQAGFKVKTTRRTVIDPALNGKVVDQTPAAGQNVAKGSTVTIVIGSGAATPTPTPSASPTPTPSATP